MPGRQPARSRESALASGRSQAGPAGLGFLADGFELSALTPVTSAGLARLLDHPGPDLVRGRLDAVGMLAEEYFDEMERALNDRSFWFVGYTSFGAWGRRPFPGNPA